MPNKKVLFAKESMFERDKTIFSGELMLSTIRQAMRDNSVGLGIQQSSKDLDSVNWAQNRLGDWMYTLHRIANVSRGTSDNRKLKILLASSGDPYVDNIRWLIDSHQMRRRVCVKGKVEKMEFVPAAMSSDEESEDKQVERLKCPVQSCTMNSSFGSTGAQRGHVRKFHAKEARAHLNQKKVFNPDSNRYTLQTSIKQRGRKRQDCKLCGKFIFNARIKEHLQIVHGKGPYERGHKV